MVVGVGIDLIELERIKQVIQRHGERFLDKVYTKHEQETCENGVTLQRLAARFAGKEAVMKALGTGWAKGVGWLDIEVINKVEGGRPQVRLSGGAQQVAMQLGVDFIHISLTHSDTVAAAIAVAEKREGGQGVGNKCAL